MKTQPIPTKAQQFLLEDASGRDRATARRVHLFELLWNERFLTRTQLMVRLEGLLERGCFGQSAWEDTFYRDMRVVKKAFKRAGYTLRYSRSKKQPGYYLRGEPRLSPVLAQAIAGSILEVDEAQIAIFRRLTPAERFRQGCSISETARRAVIHQFKRRQAEIDKYEASQLTRRQTRGDL